MDKRSIIKHGDDDDLQQQVELQQLFPNESNKNNRQTFDDEGYETIHLISANTSQTPTTTTTTTNNLTI